MDVNSSTLCPQIHLFASFSEKKRFEFEQESYDFDVIFVLTEGAFCFSMDKTKEQIAKPGDVIVCPGNTVFRRRAIETMSLFMIGFSFDKSFKSDFSATTKGLIPLSNHDAQRISDSCKRAGSNTVIKNPDPSGMTAHFCRDVINVLIQSSIRQNNLLADFVGTVKPQGVLSPEMQKILERICSANTADNVTNAVLCAEMGISEVSLIKRFREATGQTPRQFVLSIGMEQAKLLLLQNEKSISEIARLCGYGDPLYFSRIFKKKIGISPTEFRQIGKL